MPSNFNRKAFRLVVPYGVQKELAEWFGVNKSFISLVLRQEKTGPSARAIIELALKRGGYWERK